MVVGTEVALDCSFISTLETARQGLHAYTEQTCRTGNVAGDGRVDTLSPNAARVRRVASRDSVVHDE